ncbi:PHP domain-containing protein [Bariatricus sp. SGI.154]|uniref:PHP domain-containing protein n=1 Tax=Bariatricus sp. SGI.154 TaxID=3420549 RepID=UPI003CFF4680
MFIDTHMHEMTYSKDSFLKLDEMVQIAKEKGLGAICITDHDSMGLKEYAEEYSGRTGFPVFVGIEFFSLQGDIVAFGIDEYPKERIPAQDFIDLVKAQGGVCFAAHPFRNNNRGLEENLRTVKGLDGLEVLNGSTSEEACRKAARYAIELGLFTLGSSDCHVPEKVGVCATYFPEEVRTMEEFLAAFKKGEMKPAHYADGAYRIIEVEKYEKGQVRVF